MSSRPHLSPTTSAAVLAAFARVAAARRHPRPARPPPPDWPHDPEVDDRPGDRAGHSAVDEFFAEAAAELDRRPPPAPWVSRWPTDLEGEGEG